MAVQKDFNQEKPATASGVGKFFWYLSFIFIIPIFISIGISNKLNKYLVKINEADSGIDTQLTQRSDSLTKLVDVTRQAMKYEQSTLTEVTRLRNTNVNGLSTEEKADLNDKMTQLQRSINIQMEAYPNLTATQNVKSLQKSITDCEQNIAASRRIYNSNVSIYNQTITQYPDNVIASQKHLSSKPFFESTPEERKDVKMDLGF
ncbi:LemA family protein [Mesoplasma lactucae]|uniref:LemA family protein n=1 Tax=Mesoplasma lactucae ATCC 49193 TaxID=81460 RepID=A0A291ISM8_9MOLU|nr:LemA family protein [Mesoplasma lactucae]ATG97701.1 LemA family protein [Mesoplasma lactucae ATCC 49193]ATZ19833.1 LemA family protein [Mesoplasma lactucae ATCC 49193]MCL8216696.1 Protein LemA [Mesoplasma lactucae ATCC 49193]